MSVRLLTGLALVVAALVATPHPARAVTITAGQVSTSYRSYDVDPGQGAGFTIAQTAAIFSLRARFSERADLVVGSGYVYSHLDSDGGDDLTLNGLQPAGARLFVRLPGDRLLLQLTGTLPSSTGSLNPDELRVEQALGLPVLGFPVRHLAAGGEFGGTVTAAVLSRPGLGLSLGAGGVSRAEYEFAEGAGDFGPAPEWAVTAGIDLGGTEEAASPWQLDITRRDFGNDRLDGDKVFREGAQWELTADGHATRDVNAFRTSLRAVLKQDNRTFAPSGSTVGDYKASTGNLLAWRGAFDREMGELLRAGLEARVRHVSSSDASGRNGTVVEVGPMAFVPLQNGVGLDAGAGWAWGRIDGPPGVDDADVGGFVLRAGLTWTPE